MELRKQLSLLLPNKPGALAKVTKVLGDSKVNIDALSVHDSTDYGLVRLLVSDADKASSALCEAGYCACCDDVVVMQLPNRPGELAALSDKLASARVNIEYVYGSAVGRGNCLLILKVNNPKKAAQVLGG